MYVLNVGLKNGQCLHFGPFPNKDRAELYAQSIRDDYEHYSRHHVACLIMPYNVVDKVTWKERVA